MAEQLNINGLSLGEPRSYIPPHMRGKVGGPAPGPGPAGPLPGQNGTAAPNGGMNGSAWAAPAP
jgi:ATP-dependent RNA helicase DDX3X